ncbi:hypothetical protein R1sor_022952 [Riccia sorocarpa]|uniref:Uncharacterized protein n=1 Tax=Riccia sorocarpa TaxID=122646 RepID=A0ABD3GN27_9MARC
MKRLESKEKSVFSKAALEKQNESKQRPELGGTKTLAMAGLENEEVDDEEEELYSTARTVEGFKVDAADTTPVDEVLEKTFTTFATAPGIAGSGCHWSVHNNPIATDYSSSYRHVAGSSDEEEDVNPKPLSLNSDFLYL